MKKKSTTPAKLQLTKFTVARLNGFSSAGSEGNFTDSDTASTMLCKTIMN
ncbi:class I lanthipeptide [Dyadobacter sediminis]|nr:class I lanthipeptide [Dyadobacter sediminis]